MAFEKTKDKKDDATLAPLRVLPFTAALRYRCLDCGFEREEFAGDLVQKFRLGNVTAAERAADQKCVRNACGGELTVEVDTQV